MVVLLSKFDKRKKLIRKRIKERNKSNRPRIVVSKSNKNIYAQLIDSEGKVIKSYSSLLINREKLDKDIQGVGIAKLVGKEFAKLCIEAGVGEVVFDRGAYLYGGRVKALAESCRETGLKF